MWFKERKIMLNSTNPFSDPGWKKTILENEGIDPESSSNDIEEYEVLGQDSSIPMTQTTSGDLDIKSIVSSAPSLPKSAKNLIMDASALAKNEKEQKAQEMTYALSEVFTQYNEKYGTDLSIDFSSLSNTLVNVSNPETRKTLELYVSEVFKSIRPVLLLHLIQRLTLALDYILDPQRMLDSNSFSAADLFLICDKIIAYQQQLNDLVKEISIPDSDKMLKKLSEERQDSTLESEESKKAVDDFMKLFMAENNKKK